VRVLRGPFRDHGTECDTGRLEVLRRREN
jgi:hypothetical protein